VSTRYPSETPFRRARCGVLLLVLAAGCAGRQARPSEASAAEPSAAWYWNAGRAAASHGDTVRAEQYLSLAIERGIDRKKVLPVLLGVCLASSRLRAALDHAKPYLQNNPNDHALRYLVANIELGLGETDVARSELARIVREEPRHADAHYLLGILELESSPDTARSELKKYLELAPQGEHAGEVRGRLEVLAFEERGPRLPRKLSRGVQ
jgi:tetratricopeptide (TPR) repeat protein